MNKVYNTEIISVGTELLLGHVTNTDAADISEALAGIGINVKYHTVVGDNPERIRACVETAKARADIIITTGGLGPTCDDITKRIVAETFGLELVMNEAEYAGLREYLRPGKTYPPSFWNQAMLPEGCEVFHNTCGQAPGCAINKEGKVAIMLPGPPKECRAMLKTGVIPYLRKLSDELIVSHSLRIFGIGESAVDYMFRDEMAKMVNPTMAPYAKEADCLLQVTAKAKTAEEAELMLKPVMEHVSSVIGEYIYGTDIDSLEEAVFILLKEKGMTFSTAESCTGGSIAKRITELPGSSGVFAGGVVTYTNEVKSRLLGIDLGLIEENGAVSRVVAELMAKNIREILGTDIGLGVTGLAGPDGDGVNEVGTVYVSMADKDRVWVRELHLGANRSRSFIRSMACNHAYDMVRRYLSGLPVDIKLNK